MKKAIVLAAVLTVALIFAGKVYAEPYIDWWSLQHRTTIEAEYWRLQFGLLDDDSLISTDNVEEIHLIGPSLLGDTIIFLRDGEPGANYNVSFGHWFTYFGSYDYHDSKFWNRDSMFSFDADGSGNLIASEDYQWMVTFYDFDPPVPTSPLGYDEYFLKVVLSDGNILESGPRNWYGKTDLPIIKEVECRCDKDGNLWISWKAPHWFAWTATDGIGGPAVERYGHPTHVSVDFSLDWQGDPLTDPIVESNGLWVWGIPMHMGILLVPNPILTQLIAADEDDKAYVKIITRTSDDNNRGLGGYTKVKLKRCR